MAAISLDPVDLFRIVEILRRDPCPQNTYLANKVEDALKSSLRQSVFIRNSEMGRIVSDLADQIA